MRGARLTPGIAVTVGVACVQPFGADTAPDSPAPTDAGTIPAIVEAGASSDAGDGAALVTDGCEAGGATLLAVKDDLSVDAGFFAPAPGFSTSTWSFAGGGYTQSRIGPTDMALFTKDQAISEGSIDVTATALAAGTGRRSIQLVIGVKLANDVVSGFACGADTDETSFPPTLFRISKLGGDVKEVKTEVVKSEPRFGPQLNEDFTLHAELRGGTLSCRMRASDPTGGPGEYIVAAPVGATTGAFGFLTLQTKARFKQVSICKAK